MTTSVSLMVQALRRAEISFQESEDRKVLTFWMILIGQRFQARIEKKRGHFEVTFFSGVFVDESLNKIQKEKFFRMMRKINKEKGFFLRYGIDPDGEIVGWSNFSTHGSQRGLENYYFSAFNGFFGEIRETWKDLMRSYYS